MTQRDDEIGTEPEQTEGNTLAPQGGAEGEAARAVEVEAAEVEAVEVDTPHVEVVEPVDLRDQRIEQLTAELNAKTAQLREVSKAFKDLEADMDAFRARQRQAANAAADKEKARVVEAFFDPIQNLRRAIESPVEDAAELKKGMGLVQHQFEQALDRLGLVEVPGVGADFDPRVHDALAIMPVADPAQDGKVMVVHAAGYAVGDRVVQPAKVVIGKHEAPTAEA